MDLQDVDTPFPNKKVFSNNYLAVSKFTVLQTVVVVVAKAATS